MRDEAENPRRVRPLRDLEIVDTQEQIDRLLPILDEMVTEGLVTLEKARAGQGQIVAVSGEPGVGKSRLFWEFTHSHRTHGWLMLESSPVSYGRMTSYLPVSELLKTYFGIEDHDDKRRIREKVTGKILTLDDSLQVLARPQDALFFMRRMRWRGRAAESGWCFAVLKPVPMISVVWMRHKEF